jgi:G:T-mismatch repair DNA endonuclease (very short patch repair protein)
MKERVKKAFICRNCNSHYETNGMASKFCCDECRKEFKVKDGKEISKDYVICQICNRATANVTGVHLRNHQGWTPERYYREFQNCQTIAETTLKKITEGSKKAGARMKETEHRKRLSLMFQGKKNPMHKTKTSEEKRKSSSPFSASFYLKKFPNISTEKAESMAKNKISENVVISWVKEEYWVEKGFTQEESKKIISEKQSTFSLEKCISKYGEIKGTQVWKKRQDKWKSKVFNDSQHISRGYSKIGEEFINLILGILERIEYPLDNILYANKEKFIKNKEGKVFKYDLTFINSRKIIEFNGDFWHCNPIIFEAGYLNKPKNMTAKEIWEYDLKKKKAAEDNGYRIIYVWESDYRKNKANEIKRCLDYILD